MSFSSTKSKNPVPRVPRRLLPVALALISLLLFFSPPFASTKTHAQDSDNSDVNWVERPKLHEVQYRIHASKQTALDKSEDVRDEILSIMGDAESALNSARNSTSKRHQEEVRQRLKEIGPDVKDAKREVEAIRKSSLNDLSGIDVRPSEEFNSRSGKYFMGKNAPVKRLTPIEKTFEPRKDHSRVPPQKRQRGSFNPFRWVLGGKKDKGGAPAKVQQVTQPKEDPNPKFSPRTGAKPVPATAPNRPKQSESRLGRPGRIGFGKANDAPVPSTPKPTTSPRPVVPAKPSTNVEVFPVSTPVTSPRPAAPLQPVPKVVDTPEPYRPSNFTTPAMPKEVPAVLEPVRIPEETKPRPDVIDAETGVPVIVEPPRPASAIRDFNLLDDDAPEAAKPATPLPSALAPHVEVEEIVAPLLTSPVQPKETVQPQVSKPAETVPVRPPEASPSPVTASRIPAVPPKVTTPVAPPSSSSPPVSVELPMEYIEQLDAYSRKMKERQQELLKNLYNINKLIEENEEILNEAKTMLEDTGESTPNGKSSHSTPPRN
jgi:hypothetical protein